MKYIQLPADFQPANKSQIQDLRQALRRLNYPLEDKSLPAKKIDAGTTEAIRRFQADNKLPTDGTVTADTVAALNSELQHQFVATNKYRTAKLHAMLGKLGLDVDEQERTRRAAGASTLKAIRAFQKKNRLPVTGKLSEDVLDRLQEAVIGQTYTTKTQRGRLQATLQKAAAIAKLDIAIDPGELKDKTIGRTSKDLILAFQEKYRLPATGEINAATLDKLHSVAASKGSYTQKLRTPPVKQLTTIGKTLRLNMVAPEVAGLQKALSFLGYRIAEKEYNAQVFGKTTLEAVLALQKAKGLAQTGHFDKATSRVVNQAILAANPGAAPSLRYRVRGSVRDLLWSGKPNMIVRVFEKGLGGENAQALGAQKNFPNGFFNIIYTPPVNPVDGRVKDKFHLVIKLYEAADRENPVAVQTHYNVNPVHWVNFTESRTAEGGTTYDGKYAGTSEFEQTAATLKKAIGGTTIEDLKETAADRQITQLSLQTGLSADAIMRQVLARLVEKAVGVPALLNAEVFFAFLRQNLPPGLPGDLLRGAGDWETIGELIETTASGIMFLDDDTQQQVIDNAVTQNLVSQDLLLHRDAIVRELQSQRIQFTLQKPILPGDGNLQSLLDQSAIPETHYGVVASVFLRNRGVNASFWTELNTPQIAIETDAIAPEAIADFANTIETGNIALNHIPTLIFLKGNTGQEPGKLFKTAADIAKLDELELVGLINQNGKRVPENTAGDTPDEKVTNYAATLKSRAEMLYPAVALTAAVKRSPTPVLTNLAAVEHFIDTQQDRNFQTLNIDKYLLEHPEIGMDAKAKEELKVVQRVHKLTASAAAGAALIGEGLHSSMQIYFLGKDRLDEALKARGAGQGR